MLSWMTNKKVVLIGVLITGLEEALLRVTLVQRDNLLKRLLNQEEENQKRDEQTNIVWTASVCHSMVAEHVAIIVRWAAVLLLPSQRYVFDLGYEVDVHPETGYTEEVGSETLLFAILVEWLSELAIDRIALGVEFREGIPLEEFFQRLQKSYYMTGSHIFATLCATCMCLWTFTSMPNIVFCTQPGNMCSCDREAYPMYAAVFGNCTENNTVAVANKAFNSSLSQGLGKTLVDGVDEGQIVLVVIVLVVMRAALRVACTALPGGLASCRLGRHGKEPSTT